jgi:putative endonuclease
MEPKTKISSRAKSSQATCETRVKARAHNKVTKETGNKGEALIATMLEKEGYTILSRNFRTRLGEIDIIAQQHDTIAFVEVKARHNALFDVTEVITPAKQKKIMMAAKAFLAQHTKISYNMTCRFDVAIIEYAHAKLEKSAHKNTPQITYIPNAFYGE